MHGKRVISGHTKIMSGKTSTGKRRVLIRT